MNTHVYLFEDAAARHLQPLTLTRPVSDLRLGLLTIRERWSLALGADVSAPLRRELRGVFPACRAGRHGALWVNARYQPSPQLVSAIRREGSGHLRHDGTIVAAWGDARRTREWLALGRPQPSGPGRRAPVRGIVRLRYAWDIFLQAAAAIEADAAMLRWQPGVGQNLSPAAHVDRPDRLFMHPTAVVEPGAVLVADEGPILVDAHARIMAGALVRGPAAIGRHTLVKMGARIYGGTSIGPHCKVGGEVASTVFHSYSNKAHEGYVGNSVFGQWVNLGADTTASNLKMTYGNVKLLDWATGRTVDSGQQFIGTIMGDHCKTGVNTMLNTGTVCGVSTIIFGAGFPPRTIPSFKWIQPGTMVEYRLAKALVDMGRMMSRRGVPVTAGYRRMMTALSAAGQHA